MKSAPLTFPARSRRPGPRVTERSHVVHSAAPRTSAYRRRVAQKRPNPTGATSETSAAAPTSSRARGRSREGRPRDESRLRPLADPARRRRNVCRTGGIVVDHAASPELRQRVLVEKDPVALPRERGDRIRKAPIQEHEVGTAVLEDTRPVDRRRVRASPATRDAVAENEVEMHVRELLR